MKLGKAAGPSKVNVKMITASGRVAIRVIQVLDGRGMPSKWKARVVVLIFKKNGDVMNCGAYKRVKLLEHAMKMVKKC